MGDKSKAVSEALAANASAKWSCVGESLTEEGKFGFIHVLDTDGLSSLEKFEKDEGLKKAVADALGEVVPNNDPCTFQVSIWLHGIGLILIPQKLLG